MDQDNPGALVVKLKAWVSRMWRTLLKNMAMTVMETMALETKKNSKLVSSLETTTAIPREVRDSFQVGSYVNFIDILGTNEEAWGMDSIEFKIMKNYLGKSCRIVEVVSMKDVPPQYNLFITVEFSDGYMMYDVSYYAFGPQEFKVYDFEKERARRSDQLLEN